MRDAGVASAAAIIPVILIFLGSTIGSFGEKTGQICFVVAYLLSVVFIVTGTFVIAGVWKRISNAIYGFAVMLAGVTYSAGIQALGELPMNVVYFFIVFILLYVLLLRAGLVELGFGQKKTIKPPPNEYEIKNLAAKKAELARKKTTGK